MNFKINQNQNQKGFTLIETLVAITIFTIALVAMLSISGRGISDINISKNKLIANYLGDEAIEGVRALRDKYLLDANFNLFFRQGWFL